jgi:hypothetical protein
MDDNKRKKGKRDGSKVTGVPFCGASQPHSFLSEQPWWKS